VPALNSAGQATEARPGSGTPGCQFHDLPSPDSMRSRRGVPQLLDKEAEHPERVRVGPVEVVQSDQQRGPGDTLQPVQGLQVPTGTKLCRRPSSMKVLLNRGAELGEQPVQDAERSGSLHVPARHGPDEEPLRAGLGARPHEQ
jgi:hypothetical protein